MQNKPSSKVIQIVSLQGQLTALCEDGSIWEAYETSNGKVGLQGCEWSCILEAPTQPKSDLPEVGSRWERDGRICVVQEFATRVFFENGDWAMLEPFHKLYKPIPTQSDNKE